MKAWSRRQSERGFVLLLTLMLLGLLVLLLVALSTLGRVGSQLAGASQYQVQARQNALAGLGIALGELQRHAGPDDRVTGMAGVAGVAAGAGNPARHWCGVWNPSGVLQAWLVSRADASVEPALSVTASTVRLAGVMSVGNSSGAESENREFVAVERLPVTAWVPGLGQRPQGGYAYWVGDEGVKLSGRVPPASAAVPGAIHAIDEILPALSPVAAGLSSVQVFNQFAFVPAAPLTPVALAPGFHQLTVTHQRVNGPALQAGVINVNTTSSLLWKGVAGTYNAANPAQPLGIATGTFGNRMRNAFAAATGKNPGQPFMNVADFLAGNLLDTALAGSGVTRGEFVTAIGGLFAVRSDTFLIRAYGDASNAADPAAIEATAYCEAIVQRLPAAGPAGMGRRMAVIHFRWLGPDDI